MLVANGARRDLCINVSAKSKVQTPKFILQWEDRLPQIRDSSPTLGGILAVSILLVFGGVLRQLRTDAGLTQEALAHEAGLQRNFVSSLELGHKQPTLSTIYKLSAALKIRPGELLDMVDTLLSLDGNKHAP